MNTQDRKRLSNPVVHFDSLPFKKDRLKDGKTYAKGVITMALAKYSEMLCFSKILGPIVQN